jgi:hypothetical protein
MKPWTSRLKTPWFLVLGVLVFGCSRLPTAPELEPGAARSGVATSSGTMVIVDPTDPGGGPIGPPPTEVDTLVRAEDIDGRDGGEVSVGYVAVDVPEGAYAGTATVKIIIPDEDSLQCHLEIYPAMYNHFVEPVTVTFDVSHVNRAAMGVGPTETLGVYWLDESRNRWVQIPATLDEPRGKISAELSHFSQYKVAKASWNKASW